MKKAFLKYEDGIAISVINLKTDKDILNLAKVQISHLPPKQRKRKFQIEVYKNGDEFYYQRPDYILNVK